MQDGLRPLQSADMHGPSDAAENRRSHRPHPNRMLSSSSSRAPGGAVRSRGPTLPPVAPPRPPSTLSSQSKPILPVKPSGANLMKGPPPPPRHAPVSIELQNHQPTRTELTSGATTATTTSAATTTTDQPAAVITLTTPRPDKTRAQNHYVDAPLRSPPIVKQPLSRHDSFPLPQSVSKRSLVGSNHRPLLNSHHHHHHHPQSVIEPMQGSAKDKCPDDALPSAPGSTTVPESILCRKCNLCRCKACREPRRLPEYYLCNQKCSSETVVDYLSGMCVVKALLYHCGKDFAPEVDSVYENPCSLGGDYAALRCGCLGLMSLVMPCLLCYIPLKACLAGCQAAYARCAASGCRCEMTKSSEPSGSVRSVNEEVVDGMSSSSSSTPVSSGPSSPADSEKRLLSEL